MFSYEDYAGIIDAVKKSGRQCSFRDALGQDAFVIVRHDVEFSVDRALALACFETDNDFRSTYFFQVSNNSYNVLSKRSLDVLERIHDMGHDVGLHFHLNGIADADMMIDALKTELSILDSKLSFDVDAFSIHRPSKEALSANIKIDGFLNAYQDDFFSYVEDMSEEEPEVKYMSDARHRWNYGLVPDADTLERYPKVQILTHPYSWTPKGHDNASNFCTLLQERCEELVETFDGECKHFREVQDEVRSRCLWR